MKTTTYIALGLLAASLLGCSARTDKTDGGGVLLSISSFDEWPIGVAVNTAGNFVQVGEIVITSVIKNPDITGSGLMAVELSSYEVSYSRADTGTRVPPTMVSGVGGVVSAGGTLTFENLPVMSVQQLNVEPLSDLLFVNGGFDKETGSRTIVLNFTIRFFGRTLSGDAVQTAPASFSTVTFSP